MGGLSLMLNLKCDIGGARDLNGDAPYPALEGEGKKEMRQRLASYAPAPTRSSP
jgi:hypothetical protein